MANVAVAAYRPAVHYAWAEGHDYARAERELADGTGQMRMECRCGKRSQWASTYAPLLAATNRHAAATARS